MAQDRDNSPVILDARKFVRQINSGAEATLSFFKESIARIGKEAGKNLRLTSLNTNSLIYEDVDTNIYYTADIEKNGRGKIDIKNVRQVQIVEDEKPVQFNKNVRDLVESICEGNYKQADKTFSKIEGQRYRANVIPNSGWMTLKDGVARRISVSNRSMDDDSVGLISKLFCEAVKETVLVENGKIVSGTLIDNDPDFNLPINEHTKRMLIARKMRNVAEKAYQSESFQKLVLEVASLICEGKISDACNVTGKFLSEEQEFTMLDKAGTRRLVENALAANAQFNSMLAQDVSKLFYKVNAKCNRGNIVEAWGRMAKMAESADLLSNVVVLSESEDFENDLDKFLKSVFNEDRNATVASMYKLALEYVQDKIPEEEGSEESVNAKEKLNEIIGKLNKPEPDTYALIQAEEIFHTINDTITNSIDNLSNFQAEPGMEHYDDMTGDGVDSELVPIPEVGQGDELAFGGQEPEMGAMPAPGGPPMESFVKVSEMNVENLLNEFEAWRISGDTYLMEDGYDDCYSQMEAYIKRCIEIGPSANIIREGFESMRDRMVQTGDQVLSELNELEDVYSDSVSELLSGREARINNDYRNTYIESEQPHSSARVPSGISQASEPLRMDELQGGEGVESSSLTKSDGRSAGGSAAGYNAPQKGTGVAKKGAKPVDGRKGEGSTSGSAGGSTRMDDISGSGGVAKKSVSESSVKPKSSGNPALNKGGYGATNLSMGGDFQGRGGAEKKYAPHKSSGADSAGASAAKNYKASGGLEGKGIKMGDDFQGRGGVAKHDASGNHPGDSKKVDSEGGLKPASKGGDMSDLQGSGGVAEAITPENIAALIAEMESFSEGDMPEFLKDKGKDDGNGGPEKCEKCDCSKDECKCSDGPPLNDDQYKKPSMKKMGLKKSSVASESVNKIADSISEDVTAVVFRGSNDDVGAAVDAVLNGGSGGGLDLGDGAIPELETEAPMDELEIGDEDEDSGFPMSDESGLDDDEELGSELDSALSGDDEEEEEEEEMSESVDGTNAGCKCGPGCDGGADCKCGPGCSSCSSDSMDSNGS